ncbi:hypothetical protein [Streptococcus oralis]|nr:hypothetical protein [Streptococcus oralis]
MSTIEFEHPIHQIKRSRVTVSVNLNVVDEILAHFDPFVGSVY